MEQLVRWAVERERLRLKKAAGEPPPWTRDLILQRYRFCNVRRRDDRVSRWLIDYVLCHANQFDRPVFIKWVALTRWVNWPPTLKLIMDRDWLSWEHIDLDEIGDFIDELATRRKAWTGAYMVRAPSEKESQGRGKARFIAEFVVGGLDAVQEEIWQAIGSKSAEATWQVISEVPYYGSFMAGQIVADLTYTLLLEDAHDLLTWAPMGPGSCRGFNRLMNRPLKARVEQAEWLERLQEWREAVAEAVGFVGSELTLMDIQNCLCEYDKYARAMNGEGRPRSTYRPETAY